MHTCTHAYTLSTHLHTYKHTHTHIHEYTCIIHIHTFTPGPTLSAPRSADLGAGSTGDKGGLRNSLEPLPKVSLQISVCNDCRPGRPGRPGHVMCASAVRGSVRASLMSSAPGFGANLAKWTPAVGTRRPPNKRSGFRWFRPVPAYQRLAEQSPLNRKHSVGHRDIQE